MQKTKIPGMTETKFNNEAGNVLDLQPLKSYYERHVFFCLNERKNGEPCCAQYQAQQAFDHCKTQVKAAGLAGPGQVRVNKAGCMDRCAAGPVLVVYPEAVWYTYLDNADIDEIVESHLKKGQVVERLLIPPTLGR
jgi:(2Fe-2S) ferredoxin